MALNLVDIMKKVTDAVTVIAAGVAVMQSIPESDVAKADRKKILIDALNALEGDFKINISDQVESVIIEVLLAVGKITGAFKSSAAA